MSTSDSRLSYSDCFDLMEQAINSKGVRVSFGDSGAASHFRLRIHKARVIDRKENAKTYPPDHPQHGTSVFDPLVCRVITKDGKVWLYIEKYSLDSMEIEQLGDQKVDEVQATIEREFRPVNAEPDLALEEKPPIPAGRRL